MPASIADRNYLYSHYKSHQTCKVLLGIAPNGLITFVSDSYGGRASDTHISNHCGLAELLEPGDVVLCDKGFPSFKTDGAIIVTPPRSAPHQVQFSKEQMDETRKIARVRIHVERVIGRLKQFEVFRSIPVSLFPYIDAIIRFCCVLTNFSPPIIRSEANDEEDN